MSLFVDASAMVAIMTNEPEAFELEEDFDRDDDRLCSAVSLWETARALTRTRTVPIDIVRSEVEAFRTQFTIRLVPIGEAELTAAIAAHARFGKGSGHRAKLNMGDCFAYACAKANGARLLYTGDDFIHTDLA